MCTLLSYNFNYNDIFLYIRKIFDNNKYRKYRFAYILVVCKLILIIADFIFGVVAKNMIKFTKNCFEIMTTGRGLR